MDRKVVTSVQDDHGSVRAVELGDPSRSPLPDRRTITNTTVRDSMLDGSAAVTDRGEQELKGIDGNWRLFSVTSA
jgi:hypothetical protein